MKTSGRVKNAQFRHALHETSSRSPVAQSRCGKRNEAETGWRLALLVLMSNLDETSSRPEMRRSHLVSYQTKRLFTPSQTAANNPQGFQSVRLRPFLRIQGMPGGPGPSCPQDLFKIMQFSGNCLEKKPLYFEQVLGSGPISLRSKTLLSPPDQNPGSVPGNVLVAVFVEDPPATHTHCEHLSIVSSFVDFML